MEEIDWKTHAFLLKKYKKIQLKFIYFSEGTPEKKNGTSDQEPLFNFLPYHVNF